MVPLCAALIGYVCIASDPFAGGQTSITVSGGANESVAVKSDRWTATYLASSHYRAHLDPDAMNMACDEGNCVRYHRKCDDLARPRSCDFVFMGEGIPVDGVHVEGEDERAFTAAIARLSFVVRETGGLVPFSTMDTEATTANPACRYRLDGPDTAVSDQAGCPTIQRRP